MTFLTPEWFALLIAVGALAAAYVMLQRRRRQYAVRFTNLELLASVAPRRPGWRRHLAAGLVALALVVMIAALARPARDQRIPRERAAVMLAVDVSASMTATDIQPSRLGAARRAAAEFVDTVPQGFHVGLVAFDRVARLLAAPTTDRARVSSAIERLTAGTGTATGDLIDLALASIQSLLAELDVSETADGDDAPVATIVLLSDGATTVGQPIEQAAAAAAEQGVPVTTIAYGTSEGTVTIQGRTIPVPADEEAMRQVAERTGGAFFTAASADELRGVYDDIQRRIGYLVERREIVHLFVAVAVVVLVAAAAASLMWMGRFP